MTCGVVWGAAPSSYYIPAQGKSGKALVEALGNIIVNHNVLSYSDVWTAYDTTDLDSDGKVWDMYSTKRWIYGSDQCGSYSSIGSCYNREHSMPKSWFNDASPMYTDIFHLYPTDGYVNNQRSNYPFGVCANGTYVASNGSIKPLGKLGKSTLSGYSGTVFEPDDQYKGDFARTYFYMATCYYDRNSTWKSDMLAGNNYPFFQTWASDMLLEWNKLDPVSDKELARNEAVYALQGNRNPFIDHPELADYIWGDKNTQAWTPAQQGAAIILPVDGSTLDFGLTAQGLSVTKTIQLHTSGATADVTASVTGPFTVSKSSYTASQTNTGTEIQITYRATGIGRQSGTLTLNTGQASAKVTLSGETVEGLPAAAATYVTSESFRANWSYIGDDINGKYELTVTDSEGSIDGYPMMVDAATGYYDVRDLQPDTHYTYSLKSKSYTSDAVSVTTAQLQPFVDFLFDGDLYFTTTPGVPSEAAEIFVHVENISRAITISIDSPFELSLDRSDWQRSVTIDPDENRIYMRLYSTVAGTFHSTLKASAGDYYNDNITVAGAATTAAAFYEDFEASPAPESTYSPSTYYGTAATWNLYNVGYWAANDNGHDSDVAVRYGKASDNLTAIEMAEDKRGGAGIISFWAKKWSSSEATPTLVVEVSKDGGKTWLGCGSVDIDKTEWKEFTFNANISGDVRLRLRRTTGARMHLDDISISSYTTGVADPDAPRHLWDVNSKGGVLALTVDNHSGIDAGIYTVAGTTIFEGHLPEGLHTFDGIAPGQFVIITSGDFSRTVMIR